MESMGKPLVSRDREPKEIQNKLVRSPEDFKKDLDRELSQVGAPFQFEALLNSPVGGNFWNLYDQQRLNLLSTLIADALLAFDVKAASPDDYSMKLNRLARALAEE